MSSVDALFGDGNHVVLEVASVVVPNPLNLHLHTRLEVVGVDSEAGLTVAVADSVEVVADLEHVEEEDLVTGEALVTGVEAAFEAVAVASEATGMTLGVRREVEAASEVGVEVWDTKVEDSMTARLRAGLEVPLDQAPGLVDQVGTALLVGVKTMVPLEAVVLVVLAVTEDISSERAQEVSTIETPSGRDTRCFAIALHQVLL
ncbi:hypothetical protein H4582DRAFT_1577480 [Lactarius indigo]|nr:hypothetical protein H4582DRAFT_1577480 [Lactarius indigo]